MTKQMINELPKEHTNVHIYSKKKSLRELSALLHSNGWMVSQNYRVASTELIAAIIKYNVDKKDSDFVVCESFKAMYKGIVLEITIPNEFKKDLLIKVTLDGEPSSLNEIKDVISERAINIIGDIRNLPF